MPVLFDTAAAWSSPHNFTLHLGQMDLLIFPSWYLWRRVCARPRHVTLWNTFVSYYSRSLVGKQMWQINNDAEALPLNNITNNITLENEAGLRCHLFNELYTVSYLLMCKHEQFHFHSF